MSNISASRNLPYRFRSYLYGIYFLTTLQIQGIGYLILEAPKFPQKSRNRVQILGSRRVAWIKFYTEDTHFKGDLRTSPLSAVFSSLQVTYTRLQVTTWVITLKRHILVALLNTMKATKINQSTQHIFQHGQGYMF